MPFRTIFVAIDFSTHSRQALLVAFAMAERKGGRVRAIHVIDELLLEAAAVAQGNNRFKTDTDEALREFVEAESTDRYAHLQREAEVRVGRADRQILAAAHDGRADLVVLGTQGLGGVRKAFFGSTAERVLRSADIPVMAVPLDDRREPAAPTFSRVIAALDLDAAAASVALEAARVAADLEVPLTLLHVVRPLQIGRRWADAEPASLPTRLRDARAQVESVARSLEGVSAEVQVAVGAPEEQIAVCAANHADALVVVGLGEEEGLRRPGSTAYRILCVSTAPVLAVPPTAPVR